MKKILSLLLALTMTFGVFSGLSVSAEETENVTEEVVKTYGLDNVNNEAGELKIAFIGGSITQGAGEVSNKNAERYSGKLVNDYFKAKFPNKTVTEINAGIGGTPSEYGMFRLGKDVSAFAPDVVFVEFAVNDLNHAASVAGQLKVRSHMESIVRQLEALPKIPVIIFLYTHCENRQDQLESSIKEHQKIASYYGIGSINLHEYVLSEEAAGKIDWYNEENTNCMSGDGTHPNTAGYAMYAKYIADCLEANYTSFFKKPKIRNAQFEQGYIYQNPHTVKFDDENIEYTGTWTESTELDYLADGTHNWVIYPENLNSTFIQAQAGGETVSYTFTGRSIGIAYGNVFNGGKATYVVDEGTDNEITGELNANTDAIRYYQTYKLIANNLPYGEHTIKLTNVAVDDVKTNFAFSHFLVDDQEPVIGVDEVPEYAYDHIPGEMPENVMPVDTNNSPARTFATAASHNGVNFASGTTWNQDAACYTPRIMKPRADVGENTGAGFVGLVYAGYKFDNTKTYVFKVRARKTAGDDVRLGISISNENQASRTYSKEYGKEGMTLTEEYQDFATTIKVSPNLVESKTNALAVGFPAGVKADAVVEFDTSTKQSVYLGIETAYEIKNTKVSGPDKLTEGTSAEFKAEVLNQVGVQGYLNQNFTWYALNSDRTDFVEDIIITPSGDTTTATVTVAENAKSGEYAVVAVADDYSIAMGSTVRVVGSDYYKDYVAGDMPENLINDGKNTPAYIFSGAMTRNSGTYIQGSSGSNLKENVWGNGNCFSKSILWTLADITETKQHGFYGAAFKKVTYEPNKSYVVKIKEVKQRVEGFSANIGDVTLSEGEAKIGLALTNEKGDGTSTSYSKEYGKEGMLLTDEYQEFKATIKAANGFSSASTQSLVFGFPAGTKVGIAAEFGWNSPDAAYIAEEVAYDIATTKVSGPEKLSTASNFVLKAEVLNQIGLTGYLTQDVDWYAMNTARSEFEDGFEITENNDGTVTVAVDETVKTGEYSIVAVSDTYGMAKGINVKVVADDYYYDFVSPAKATNLFDQYGLGTSENYFRTGVAFSRNNGDVNGELVKEGDNTVGYIFKANADLGYSVYQAVPGWILTKERTWSEFPGFKKDKTYVFKARLKDVSNLEGEPAIMNIALHNETGSSAGIAYSDVYGEDGLALTSEYQEFITTIKPTASFNEGAKNQFLTLGFVPGTIAGTQAQIDLTGEDSVYLAEQQIYDITNELKSGSTTFMPGSVATFEAKVLNQLEVEGTLAQNFTWVAMDTERKNFIDGITITTADDTGIATVTVSEDVAVGEYAIVAVSTDYDIARGINITVVENMELISALNLIQDAGYAQLVATVENAKASKVKFILAKYEEGTENLLGVISDEITVVDGMAECDIFFDEVLENGTIVKAFVWDGMRPIENVNNFETTIVINTAE